MFWCRKCRFVCVPEHLNKIQDSSPLCQHVFHLHSVSLFPPPFMNYQRWLSGWETQQTKFHLFVFLVNFTENNAKMLQNQQKILCFYSTVHFLLFFTIQRVFLWWGMQLWPQTSFRSAQQLLLLHDQIKLSCSLGKTVECLKGKAKNHRAASWALCVCVWGGLNPTRISSDLIVGLYTYWSMTKYLYISTYFTEEMWILGKLEMNSDIFGAGQPFIQWWWSVFSVLYS